MAAVTFGAMKTRISQETNRDSADELTAIGNAIVTAIRFYDRKPFWFTEQNGTLSLLVSTNTVALPSDFRALITLRVLVNGRYITQDTGFQPVPYEQLKDEETDPTRTGQPRMHALFGGAVRVTPLADQTYSMDIDYVRGDLVYPSADGDSSLWLGDEGQDLIRNKAKAIFYRDYCQAEEDKAEFYERQASMYYDNLVSDSNTRYRSLLNA